ncbi:MAG TPA: hypothetical protein VEK82_00090 [Stellaceae bacterium]|nr:hypothetical protein [Stellaceae bacterium]
MSLPLAAAALTAVDDAAVLVTGGAEFNRAGHRAVADPPYEAIGEIARLIAPREREAYSVAVERALDRALELRRALVSGELAAVLLPSPPQAPLAIPPGAEAIVVPLAEANGGFGAEAEFQTDEPRARDIRGTGTSLAVPAVA